MDAHKIYSFVIRTLPFRARRMRNFESRLAPTSETEILDLGGTAENWKLIGSTPRVVLLNLDTRHDQLEYPPNISFVAGDATSLAYPDASFDIVFSNSVIEHVGGLDKQRAFAREAMRVGRQLWIQTPAREFFLEPHLIAPFIHWLPTRWQTRLVRYFSVWGLVTKPSSERAREFLASTKMLGFAEFAALFPGCEVVIERWLGMPKSYIAVRSVH